MTKKTARKKTGKSRTAVKTVETPPRLIISLPPDIRGKLEKLAKSEGLSMAKTICRLIEAA